MRFACIAVFALACGGDPGARVPAEDVDDVAAVDTVDTTTPEIIPEPVLDVPAEGLYVVLTWRTPGDLDENDSGGDGIYFSLGSDMDLHLVHAKGTFFDPEDDAFYGSREPDWGPHGAAGDPIVERDDNDGAGPEIIRLAAPEPSRAYTIGVHYYSDWGYGPAFATVRVYVDGALADAWADVQLERGDLWQSHVVVDGVAHRIGTKPAIHRGVSVDTGVPPPSGLAIVADRDGPVPPGDEVRLRVANDPGTAPPATIEWSLAAPAGSLATLPPSPYAREVTLTPDVFGSYGVAAIVRDGASGETSVLSHTILAATITDLRVELTWRTPGDPDPDDTIVSKHARPSVGADLDLYLLHPGGGGRLNDRDHVCAWYEPSPDWGALGAADDPHLERDDWDGGGPEAMTLRVLEPGATYTIAARYYNDPGFGPAFATLRVWLGEALVDTWPEVELVSDDIWRAFTVTDGVVARIGDAPAITTIAEEPP